MAAPHAFEHRLTAVLQGYVQVWAKHAAGRQGIQPLLVKLAGMTRTLKDSGLAEGASTRLLIQVGKLIGRGIPAHRSITAG